MKAILPAVIGNIADDVINGAFKLLSDEIATRRAVQQGIDQQVARDNARAVLVQHGMIQAEESADRTQSGLVDAAKKGQF